MTADLRLKHQDGPRVVIPRSVYEVMRDNPDRFGFTSPELQQRFKDAVDQRKLAVAKRQWGGLSGRVRAAYAHWNWRDGEYSHWNTAPMKAKMNTDPEEFHRGPVLRPRNLDEAKEIYEVLAQVLAYWRVQCKAERDPELKALLEGNMRHLHRTMRFYRSECLSPLWVKIDGIPDEEQLDSISDQMEAMDAWRKKVRKNAEQLVSEFDPKMEALAANRPGSRMLAKMVKAYVMIPKAVAALAYLWTEKAPWEIDKNNAANTWERIIAYDALGNRAAKTPVSRNDVDVLKEHLAERIENFPDDGLLADHAALKKLADELDILAMPVVFEEEPEEAGGDRCLPPPASAEPSPPVPAEPLATTPCIVPIELSDLAVLWCGPREVVGEPPKNPNVWDRLLFSEETHKGIEIDLNIVELEELSAKVEELLASARAMGARFTLGLGNLLTEQEYRHIKDFRDRCRIYKVRARAAFPSETIQR